MLTHHPALLQQLQQLAGDTLSADAQGNCLIDIDDVEVTLKSRENTLIVHALLGSFLAVHSVGFWRKLMELNAPLIEADRGAIAVGNDGDTVVLVNNIDTTALHDDLLPQAISTTVAQARQLIDRLNAEIPDPMTEDDAPAALKTQTETQAEAEAEAKAHMPSAPPVFPFFA
jgi:hypothetical protein